MDASITKLNARTNDGKVLDFKDLTGKVLLIVNTASKCGFTPQYEGLEALHRKYGEKGLTVIGFPCDQFANQEPGSDSDIANFCKLNYGVSFTLMSKIDVNGEGTHPVFLFLKKKAGGVLGSDIKWNFTKFLVAKDGKTVKRFAPTTEPVKLEKDIEAALG